MSILIVYASFVSFNFEVLCFGYFFDKIRVLGGKNEFAKYL